MSERALAREGAGEGPIDLHTHSTASDGAKPPGDVVRAAVAAGLSAVALTDHDTIAGLGEAVVVGATLGIRVIAGIELSAVEGDSETHVLGLHLSEPSALEHRLVQLREMRLARAVRIVERLNALGIPIQLERVLAEAAGGAVGRPHVARAMIAGGWAGDFRQAFERFLGNGKAAYVPKDQLPAADAIAMIQAAGGLAVLAHPGGLFGRDRLVALAQAGLDGIEILHPSHSWDDAQRLDALAGELDLVRSGGSDWHGSTDGTRSLGMMRVPGQWLREHEARLATRPSRRVA